MKRVNKSTDRPYRRLRKTIYQFNLILVKSLSMAQLSNIVLEKFQGGMSRGDIF